MPKFDYKNIPAAIVIDHIAPNLDDKDLTGASIVSKHWASTFGDKVVYMNKLLAEFGIKKEQYQEFTALQKNIDYKKFYLRFKELQIAIAKHRSIYDAPRRYLADPLFAPAQRTSIVLMLCADDLDYFKKHFNHLNENQLGIIGGMAAVTNSRKIGDYCFNKMYDKYSFLNAAAEAGNLSYVKDLLALKILDLEPGIMTMRKALKSGSEDLIDFLEKDYGFNPLDLKEWAAENGELSALNYIKKREAEQARQEAESTEIRSPGVGQGRGF